MERIELSFFRLRDGCLGQHKLHRLEDWPGREGAAVVASLSLRSLRRVAFSTGMSRAPIKTQVAGGGLEPPTSCV